jgi:predicted extracellular nuclease
MRSIFPFFSYLIIGVFLIGASCERVASTQNSDVNGSDFVVAFYNVENLFDTSDDPKKNDEDFTPSGKLAWTEDRYQVKLGRIAQVIDSIPGMFPAIMGLCEIENKRVLDDLVKEKAIAGYNYSIIHEDSPDERGIDVAMLYDPKRIKILFSKYTTVNLPNDADPYTRDILYVKAETRGEVLHLFVNHWPSRGGGQAESEGNRIAVANVVDMLVGDILKADANANILLMGDFNDFPSDKSVSTILNAGVNSENRLFNYMYDDEKAGKGSYFYKGSWSPLDQFMASKGLHEGKGKLVAPDNAASYYMGEFFMFTTNDGQKRPNRTYVGEDYKAGYSDHLPEYITIQIR